MYVHSFYRAGPVMGSAISGIDQALWDIRGKAARRARVQVAGRPRRSARRARLLSRAARARRESWRKLRETAIQQGVSCFKIRHSRLLRVDRDARKKSIAPSSACRCCAKGSGPDIDIADRFSRQDQSERGVDHREGSRAAESAVHRGAVSAGERAGDGARSRGAPRRRSRRASDWWRTMAAAN